MRKVALCALLCALEASVSLGALAQSDAPRLRQLHHVAWTNRDGAPSQVGSLAQSADGFLWLGTRLGLYRFDGVHFERFDAPAGTSLPGLAINMLLALPDTSLWIGYAFGGASVLAGGRLVNYGERDGLPRGTVTAFARDSDGTMWAATTTGLACLINGRWQRVGAERGFPGGLTADLLVDRRGTLWVSEISGVYVLPRGARRFVRRAESLDGGAGGGGMPREAPDGSVWGASVFRGLVHLSNPDGTQPSPDVLAYRDSGWTGLIIDHARNAWLIGRYAELVRVRLSGAAGSALAVPESLAFSRAAGMSGNQPTYVLEDREGNVWVATEGGIDQFHPTKLTPVVWPGVYVPAIAAADDGAIWAGSRSDPLMQIRDRGDRLVKYAGVGIAITCAYRDSDGDIWVGGPRGLWRVHRGAPVRIPLPSEIAGTEVQAIARDRDGTLWLAARGKGTFYLRAGKWERFGAPLGLAEQPVITIAADSAGRTWLGYTQSRIARVDGDSLRLYSTPDGLRVGTVTAIFFRGGRVWAGGDQGLATLDAAHGARFRPFGIAAGLLRGVTGIIETAAGDLWLNGADGVTHVVASQVRRALADSTYLGRAERFDFRDGLEGSAQQMRPLPSAIQGTDGRLWFTTERGVVWVDPMRLHRNAVPPLVIIEKVRAGERSYTARPDRLTMPKRTTDLGIVYTATSLSVGERVRFRYRLTGKAAGWRHATSEDTSWQDAGARREAVYTNLVPGIYRFQVAAANDDGLWNEHGAAIEFFIPPTFVDTNLFLVLCAAAAAFVVWLLLQWRQRQLARALRARFEATLTERTRIAQELHDTLLQGFIGVTAQLHAVRRMLSSRPADAVNTLTGALATADATLREARHAVWEMRSPELTDRDLPDALAAASRDALATTPTALQLAVCGNRRPLPRSVEITAFRICREAVVNAAKHANARVVALDIEYGPRTLTIVVRDDGRGIAIAEADSAASNGHWGVVGMRERARKAGGTLDIARRTDGGTKVTLCLPLDDGERKAGAPMTGRDHLNSP
jgi:signal transduction histidine kinase